MARTAIVTGASSGRCSHTLWWWLEATPTDLFSLQFLKRNWTAFRNRTLEGRLEYCADCPKNGRIKGNSSIMPQWNSSTSGRYYRWAICERDFRRNYSSLWWVDVCTQLNWPNDIHSRSRPFGSLVQCKPSCLRLSNGHLTFNRYHQNAGVSAKQVPIETMSLETFQTVININLVGCFITTREAIRVFKSQTPQGGNMPEFVAVLTWFQYTLQGRIINNGSLSAHVPRPHSFPYTCSKHAITGLTKCTALDGRPFNITCTQLDIGEIANALRFWALKIILMTLKEMPTLTWQVGIQ